MRELKTNEVVAVNGAWLGFAFAAARLAWAVYRHHKMAHAASWAARGAAISSGTYQGMAALDEYTSKNR